MLRGFGGFQGELSKYWDNVASRSNADTLRIMVQDKTRNERRNGTGRRSIQPHGMHESSPTVTDADAQPDDLRSLLDAVVNDENASNTLVSEQKKSLEFILNESHESLEPTETVDGLLAKVGSDLELAILSDRLAQSASTLVSLQSDVGSTKDQLRLPNDSHYESLVQQHSQKDFENMIPTTPSENDTLNPPPRLLRPVLSSEIASLETSSKSAGSEISEIDEKDSYKESPAINETTSKTNPSKLASPNPRI